MVKAAALIYQSAVPWALELVEQSARLLADLGLESILLPVQKLDGEAAPPDLSLGVTFGGDGTILRAARWLAGSGTPIVGVQMGRLGFLAEVQPGELPAGLAPYIRGDCWLDRRAMVRARLEASDKRSRVKTLVGLNEIVVGRGASARTVTVDVTLQGQLLQRFYCDGLIVATATGSTAHSLAAGGPVLTPDSRALVMTPICPHIAALRAVVVPGEQPFHLRLWSPQPGLLTLDGQVEESISDGTTVEVGLSEQETVFARRGTPTQLYRRILAKLAQEDA